MPRKVACLRAPQTAEVLRGFFVQRGPWPDASPASEEAKGGLGEIEIGVCSPKGEEEEKGFEQKEGEEGEEFEQEETEVTELAPHTGTARHRGSDDSFRQAC